MAETRPSSVKNILNKQRATMLKPDPSWSSKIQFLLKNKAFILQFLSITKFKLCVMELMLKGTYPSKSSKTTNTLHWREFKSPKTLRYQTAYFMSYKLIPQ